MQYEDKSNSLAEKMNKITEKFSENLDTALELEVTGDDIIDFIEEKTQKIELYDDSNIPTTEIINLTNLVEDFKFVRETLKENTENGRRVMNAVTLDLLDSDISLEIRSELITSFADLNKSIADNMKLYVQSYKEISNVLINIGKLREKQLGDGSKTVNNTSNTININSPEIVSTVELIKQLTQTKN
jgi:hypothetical protein